MNVHITPHKSQYGLMLEDLLSDLDRMNTGEIPPNAYLACVTRLRMKDFNILMSYLNRHPNNMREIEIANSLSLEVRAEFIRFILLSEGRI